MSSKTMRYSKTYHYGYLIKSFYLSPKESDLTIIVEGQPLFAHKLVLIRQSIVFRKMLFGVFKESIDKQIEIKDINLETFKVLLKFCYKEDLLPEDWPSGHHLFVIDVLKCAHLYQIKRLCVICELKLIGQMSVHNMVDIYEIGLLLQSKRIVFFAKKFIKHRAEELITSEELLNCKSIEILKSVIKGMPSVDPFLVIKTLIAIIKRNEVEDKDWNLIQFFDCIQIEKLSTDVLNYIEKYDSKSFPKFALKRIQLLEESVNELKEEIQELSTNRRQVRATIIRQNEGRGDEPYDDWSDHSIDSENEMEVDDPLELLFDWP